MPPITPDQDPIYCRLCGWKLQTTSAPIPAFDEQTGAPMTVAGPLLACPNTKCEIYARDYLRFRFAGPILSKKS